MKLYDYYRSTACYRVRIALHLKQVTYETCVVHLVDNGGEQKRPEYLAINPQGLVPTLEHNGKTLSQSLAIIEYLNELYPHPPLLPPAPYERAQVRSLALMVACDMHPLNNLRVLTQLKTQFNATEEDIQQWYHHWLQLGFDSFEAELKKLPHKGLFCFGDSVSLADVCLIPQMFNAKRFHFPLDNYELLNEIYSHCMDLEAFQQASPK